MKSEFSKEIFERVEYSEESNSTKKQNDHSKLSSFAIGGEEKVNYTEEIHEIVADQQYHYMDSETIEKDLICSICHFPFINPILHSECGQMFCSSCVTGKVDKCPLCRGSNLTNNSVAAPKYILNKLNQLKVQCSMCKGGVERGELRIHQEKYCPLHDAYKQVEELKQELKREYEELIQKLKVENEQSIKQEKLNLNLKEQELIQQFKLREELMEKQMKEFENQKLKREKFEISNKPIHLNVRGTIMTVSLGDFIQNEREPDNLFNKMFTGEYPLHETPSNTFKDAVYFINCDPLVFKYILEWLQFGGIDRDLNDFTKESLINTSNRFGLQNLAKRLSQINNYQKEKITKSKEDTFFEIKEKSNANIQSKDINSQNSGNTYFEPNNNNGLDIDFNSQSLNSVSTYFESQRDLLTKSQYYNPQSLHSTIIEPMSSISSALYSTTANNFNSQNIDFKSEGIDCNSQNSVDTYFEPNNNNVGFDIDFKSQSLDSVHTYFEAERDLLTKSQYYNPQSLNSTIIEPISSISSALYTNTKSQSIPQLLYRGTRDGFNAQNFHAKCDNQGPTLTIIKSKHNQIFGAFTTKSWKSTQQWEYISDSSAFIFKITNSNGNYQFQKFNIRPNQQQYAIRVHKDYLPIFGGGYDIRISNDCSVNNSSSNFGDTYELPNGYHYGSNEANTYLAGSKKFKVDEIEVFKINQ